MDVFSGVGGLSLTYSSVRTWQSCRVFICLARRKGDSDNLAIAVERLCRKHPYFGVNSTQLQKITNRESGCKQAQGSRTPSWASRRLAEHPAAAALALGWGFVPGPALEPFRLPMSISPKCIAAQCQPCCSCAWSALGLCPRRSVGLLQPRNPGPPARAFGPAWMRRAGSSALRAAQGGDSGALHCWTSAGSEAFGGVQGYGMKTGRCLRGV